MQLLSGCWKRRLFSDSDVGSQRSENDGERKREAKNVVQSPNVYYWYIMSLQTNAVIEDLVSASGLPGPRQYACRKCMPIFRLTFDWTKCRKCWNWHFPTNSWIQLYHFSFQSHRNIRKESNRSRIVHSTPWVGRKIRRWFAPVMWQKKTETKNVATTTRHTGNWIRFNRSKMLFVNEQYPI